jgi:hypothetical protein
MNSEMFFELVVLGALLAGMMLVLQKLQPDLHRVLLFAAVFGGALCILWGVLGCLGVPSYSGAVMTLVPIAGVLAFHLIQSLKVSTPDEPNAGFIKVILAVLLLFTLGTIGNLLHASKEVKRE